MVMGAGLYSRVIITAIAVFPLGLRAADATFPEVVRAAVDVSKKQDKQFKNALAAIDTKTIVTDEERAVILFARGLSVFQTRPKEAAEDFDAAKKLLPGSSRLAPLLSIYYGRATLTPQDARAILAKLKALTNGSSGKSSLWRPEQFSLMIDIMMALKQDSLLGKAWREMESRVKPAMRDDEVAKKVVAYLDRRDIASSKDLVGVVESMASGYPHSENGRWAFQKLQEMQCRGKNRYVFSLPLISRLASNINLDEGLKYFLIELTKGPVRTLSGQVKQMDESERIVYLFQIRLWNEAKRLVEEQLDSLAGSRSSEGKIKLARAMSLLGQIQTKQGDHEASARSWSQYIALFGEQIDSRQAMENLADSLARLRAHEPAAKIYEYLAKSPSSDPMLKWQHFWNTYLGGDYKTALALLDRAGYVPQRDRGIDGGLDYWRAKILERLKSSESDNLYKKILSDNGDNFYSLLVQARKPRLMEVAKADNFTTHDPLLDISLAGGSALAGQATASHSAETLEAAPETVEADGTANGVNDQSEIKAIQALKKWGLSPIGRRLFRLMPTVHQHNGNATWIESFRLATDLKDFAYGLKAPAMPDSPLKNIPNASAYLEIHMNQYNADWKLLYPFAYREQVEAMAAAAEVDPFLLLSLMRAESVYDPKARSSVGARGLMQIMPFTAVRIARMMQDTEFQLNELHQPEVNIGYASFYVKKLTDYYKGNTMMAVAAYNGGPAPVDKWIAQFGDLELDEFIETIPFRETRRYVKSVFRNFNNYKHIWQQSKALAALPKVPDGTTGGEIF